MATTKKNESQYLRKVTRIDAPSVSNNEAILKVLTDAGYFLNEVKKPLAGCKDFLHYYEVYERID